MDDDKIKGLFRDFQPARSSDTLFMNRLKRNMESVELVKSRTSAMRRRSRAAMIVSAISGFVVGLICALVYPLIESRVTSLSVSIPFLGIPEFTIDLNILAWLVATALCVGASLASYEFMRSRPYRLHHR